MTTPLAVPFVSHARFARRSAWLVVLGVATALIAIRGASAATVGQELADWSAQLDERVIDAYEDVDAGATLQLPLPETAMAKWGESTRALVATAGQVETGGAPGAFPYAAGRLRARVQQAITIEMAAAVRAGRAEDAKALRCMLFLPRGVSAHEGSLLLQSLGAKQPDEAARLLTREAITWQTTRVRQLFDQAARSAQHVDAPLPGRLAERLGEALALADLPPALQEAAGLQGLPAVSADLASNVAVVRGTAWNVVASPLVELRKSVEQRLPTLLTDDARIGKEKLLLKLCILVPREYAAGIRNGEIAVPLEYHEAINFTQQARQIVGELAPLWLADAKRNLGPEIESLEAKLEEADGLIAAKAGADDVEKAMNGAADILKDKFGINLRRAGNTTTIVLVVMAETRDFLGQSLSAALAGDWKKAEELRLEAYTTYDPELEARLMPRDPQLALDIERLLLDGIDQPGVKVLLDRRAPAEELHAAYARVYAGLNKATAVLQTTMSPTAAALNAGSIVLREGLEGLLVIVAIFAGLRGPENARRRRLFWVGIVGSFAATALTWALSLTILTSLKSYAEIIAAVTGLIAIVILLLITNWLFHQVYWKQWVTTLKTQAQEGESVWQLMSVGFLVGYREGFETVLFLQSLMLDAGGKMVGLGVSVGLVILLVLGIAALWAGMKLPYMKILLVTAGLIGVVLITFVGGTVRAMQTVGWLPVHRLMPGSWPTWLGNWLGLYNTWESVIAQVLTAAIVLGTWRYARYQSSRKTAERRAAAPVRASKRESLPDAETASA